MQNNIEELRVAIKEKKVLLFVGSGISCSVGLPSWSRLIEELAKKLGIDKDLYRMLGDNLSLAEYYEIFNLEINPAVSPMKYICEYVKGEEKKLEVTISTAKVLKQIIDLDCPIIYTTNYDHCLETAYSEHNKHPIVIRNVSDFSSICAGETQIVKLHGDYDSPQSIVFSESSYFDRLDFESPLDIKLRADMLSRSILFIGYSLSDVNIRLLIHKLDKLWRKNGELGGCSINKRPNSYIFMAQPNYIQEKILVNKNIIPIIGEGTDPRISTERFLESIQPK